MTDEKFSAEEMAAHIIDPDYPGVIFTLGNNRVALAAKATRFALQLRCNSRDGETWPGTFYAYRSTLHRAALERYGPELAEAVLDNLPERPCDALPDFQAAMRARVAAFHATDWTRDDYLWVLRAREYQSVTSDGETFWREWLRLIVTPGRAEIALQLKAPCAPWVSAKVAESPDELRDSLTAPKLHLTRSAARVLAQGEMAQLWQGARGDGALLAMLDGVPDDLRDLQLPPMPERPLSRAEVKGQRAKSAGRDARSAVRPAPRAALSASEKRAG